MSHASEMVEVALSMTKTEAEAIPPPFVGSHGEGWCARPAMFGTPDKVSGGGLYWLIAPGPPIACYASLIVPLFEKPQPMDFYHQHPNTWSLHVICSGRAKHFTEGQEHDLVPGSVVFLGPKVRHCLVPDFSEPLFQIVVQSPGIGWGKDEWVTAPEAGTTDRFGDLAAFVERHGQQANHPGLKTFFESERWRHYVAKVPREK